MDLGEVPQKTAGLLSHHLIGKQRLRAVWFQDADETLPSAFRDLAQKDSAWEGR